MGLFSRTKDDAPKAPLAAPGKSFGHAAFDRADIDDARRGHPAVSLEAFALANGLNYSNNEVYGSFLSTLPVWPEYIFNICRGGLGGRLTQICHELLEMEASEGSIRGGGTFYDVRVTTRRSAREMLNLGTGDPENAPFVGNAVWIPTTTVHIRTPEVNQLPTFWIRKDGEMTLGRSTLDRHGLSGFRIGPNLKVDDPFSASVATALRRSLGVDTADHGCAIGHRRNRRRTDLIMLAYHRSNGRHARGDSRTT